MSLDRNQPPDPAKAEVLRWLADELERVKLAHGKAWPKHEEWVRDYLRQEARERLAALRGVRR